MEEVKERAVSEGVKRFTRADVITMLLFLAVAYFGIRAALGCVDAAVEIWWRDS